MLEKMTVAVLTVYNEFESMFNSMSYGLRFKFNDGIILSRDVVTEKDAYHGPNCCTLYEGLDFTGASNTICSDQPKSSY